MVENTSSDTTPVGAGSTLLYCWVGGGGPDSPHTPRTPGRGGLTSLVSGREESPVALLRILWRRHHPHPRQKGWELWLQWSLPLWVGDLFKQMISGFYFVPSLTALTLWDRWGAEQSSGFLKQGQTVSLFEYGEGKVGGEKRGFC